MEKTLLHQEKTKLEIIIRTAINEFNGNTDLKVKEIKCDYLPQPTNLTIVDNCKITFE